MRWPKTWNGTILRRGGVFVWQNFVLRAAFLYQFSHGFVSREL